MTRCLCYKPESFRITVCKVTWATKLKNKVIVNNDAMVDVIHVATVTHVGGHVNDGSHQIHPGFVVGLVFYAPFWKAHQR